MEIPNIKPNHNIEKPEKPAERKIVTGVVKKREPSGFQKFIKGFLPEDRTSVKEYVIETTPGLIKTVLRELLLGTIDTYLPGGAKAAKPSGTIVRTAYNSFSQLPAPTTRAAVSSSVYDYENLVFEDFHDAQIVLDQMFDTLSRFEFVSVLDLYDFVGTYGSPTDKDYGWYDLRGSHVIRTSDGLYRIVLPRAVAYRK